MESKILMNQSSNLTTNSNTYDTLFALLRSTLWGEERFPFVLDMENPPNWDEICKELSFQTVRKLYVNRFLSEFDHPAKLQYSHLYSLLFEKSKVKQQRLFFWL